MMMMGASGRRRRIRRMMLVCTILNMRIFLASSLSTITRRTRQIHAGRCVLRCVSSSSFDPSTSSIVSCSSLQHRKDIKNKIIMKPEEHQHQPIHQFLDLQLPEGRCVGLQLPTSVVEDTDSFWTQFLNDKNSNPRLHPAEIRYGWEHCNIPSTRTSFWMGRLALRTAAGNNINSRSSDDSPPLLKDAHGRPQLPPGYVGSISHKESAAVAIVQQEQTTTSKQQRISIGVDLETTRSGLHKNVARKVLTVKERGELGWIPGISSEQEVLLRFSLKEAVYKAIHPLICQFVGFQQADIQPLPGGDTKIELRLHDGTTQRKLASVTATWRIVGEESEYFLTSAIAKLQDGVERDVEGCIV